MTARRVALGLAVVGLVYGYLWSICRAAEYGHRLGLERRPLVDP